MRKNVNRETRKISAERVAAFKPERSEESSIFDTEDTKDEFDIWDDFDEFQVNFVYDF